MVGVLGVGCGFCVVLEGMGRDQEIDEKAKNQSLANVLKLYKIAFFNNSYCFVE